LRGALFSAGPPGRESDMRNREQPRCGCTQFDWVAEVGWTHRASSSPVGRKTCWSKRALARKKSLAPPDAERGWTEGETVRVREVKQLVSSRSVCGSPLAGSRHDRRRSRASARLAFTGRATQGPLTRRSTPRRPPQTARSARRRTDSTSGGHGFRLGCACG
jgi:hypothetical protein